MSTKREVRNIGDWRPLMVVYEKQKGGVNITRHFIFIMNDLAFCKIRQVGN